MGKNSCSSTTSSSFSDYAAKAKGSMAMDLPSPHPHPYCDLDERGTLCLGNIIESLNTPISEEHAWALCYQCAKCGNAILREGDEVLKQRCALATKSSHILIQKDGLIHADTFLLPPLPSSAQGAGTSSSGGSEGRGNTSITSGKGPPRIKCSTESKLISKLGTVIFYALEYGNQEDEERHLCSELWSLLDSMASADESTERPETDDEGIERDSGESDEDGAVRFTFNNIIEICTERLDSSGKAGSTASADLHYKAVCRALVAEALELSTFLKKVSEGTHQMRTAASFGGPYKGGNHLNSQREPEPDLNKLNFTDWARLWVQVIQQLRQGVKLKKVDFGSRCTPIEYELTPYEILMDDIRAKRFELKKVMQNGSLPHRIKKDAHAIILEFIRSRPPLKKAADRVLGPPPKAQEGPIELLMKSIREEHKLKPTSLPSRKDSTRTRAAKRIASMDMTEINSVNNNKSSCPSSEIQSQQQQQPPQRRLIKADLDVLYSLNTKDEDDDDDEGDDECILEDSTKDCFYGHICPEGTQSSPVTPCRRPNDSRFENGEINQVDLRRRHSINNPTVREDHGATMITFPFEYTNSLNVFKSLNCPRASPILNRRRAKLSHSVSKSSLQEEFFQSNHWQTAIECLSLNLEEVVHIRNVLTKAELESLPLECSLKEDVQKGKVCFLCLKTRFSLLFGPWGNSCKLCKRTVCAKCCSKMRIPTDHFAQVPVSSLSPTISPRDEEKEFVGPAKSLTPTPSGRENFTPPNSISAANLVGRKNSVGSAPTSPNLSRKSGADTDSDSGQRSISPGIMDEEERDSFGPPEQNHGHGNGPRSLPTVTSISLGLMAFKRRSFGRGQDKTDKLKGSLMVVCHDCRAMIHKLRKRIKLHAHHHPSLPIVINASTFSRRSTPTPTQDEDRTAAATGVVSMHVTTATSQN